jgi:signal transduction histidine kinase
MALRHLYLRIYLTMLAVLLVFALVAGVLVRRHTDSERGRIESAVSERTAAWAQLLGNSLPPADAPPEQQAASLRDWSERLRLPLALDAADGQRLATSESYAQVERAAGRASEGPASGADAVYPGPGPVRAGSVQRVLLADGRSLWVGRPPRPDRGPPWVGPPGLRPDKFGRPDPGGAPPPDAQGDGPVPRLHWHAPRWLDDAGVLLGLLGVLFLAVAASAWPVVRRLTRRLESLQRGVEVFGSGQLGHRVPEGGRDEVATLAASFNRAAERIEKLVQANRSLLANASHELRSPLARLKMALAVLEGAAPARRDELRREIDRNIRELDTLVEEVLLASRLDASHRLQREPVDLLGLLAEEAARVDAEVEGEALTLPGDERLLRRALRNLLENARRYGGDEVLATLHAVPGGGVEVRVCDRGPGVPEAYRERVFEPFFRLPGHAEREGGVGLGLSLVRQIAEQHGGQVHCEAREGGGSCFRLSLPGPG